MGCKVTIFFVHNQISAYFLYKKIDLFSSYVRVEDRLSIGSDEPVKNP